MTFTPMFVAGDVVVIDGVHARNVRTATTVCRTTLVARCNDIGGWHVDPPVDGLRMWNQDAMTMARHVPGVDVGTIVEVYDAGDRIVDRFVVVRFDG